MLLSHAAQRPDANVLPLPTSITAPRAALEKSIGALLSRGLIEKVVVSDVSRAWSQDGEQRYGLRICDAGLVAIGVVAAPGAVDEVRAELSTAKKFSKLGAVLELLMRGEGATLDDLVVATGWLPHTTRAVLTGLRKKGYAIAKAKRDGITCYSISVVA
ncbi:DUF3489 domain-containing protein [Sphingomonas sp. GC_Shp_3]|uniref:DUF3489 domain-containing protein n=1 Tax=Sphingomonas sp. GC_Shp_3 TaxID=2937383 RepID=UPI00226A4141